MTPWARWKPCWARWEDAVPRKLDKLLAPPSGGAKPVDPPPQPAPKAAPAKKAEPDDTNKTLREVKAKRKEKKPNESQRPAQTNGGGADLLRPGTWKLGFFR
jgi:hypothetical protein